MYTLRPPLFSTATEMLAMEKHEFLAQLAAQIAAGMTFPIAPGAVPDDKSVAKRAVEMAKMILTEARGTPASFFGSAPKDA